MEPAYELISTPRVLIVDGAGTLFDPGSMVPVHAFEEAFKNHGLDVPRDIITRYMGREKKEHVKCILDEPYVKGQIETSISLVRPTPESIHMAFCEALYPLAIKTERIPGVFEALARLRDATKDDSRYQGYRVRDMEGTADQGFQDGVFLAMTTGYDCLMAERSLAAVGAEDFLNTWVASDTPGVNRGRPAPDMIEVLMREINTSSSSLVACVRDGGAAQEWIGLLVNKRRIWDYRQVLVVGDTKVDLEAADNCGMPSALVLSGSIRTQEEARRIDEEIGRAHIVYPSLVEIVHDIESEMIPEKIRWLNRGLKLRA